MAYDQATIDEMIAAAARSYALTVEQLIKNSLEWAPIPPSFGMRLYGVKVIKSRDCITTSPLVCAAAKPANRIEQAQVKAFLERVPDRARSHGASKIELNPETRTHLGAFSYVSHFAGLTGATAFHDELVAAGAEVVLIKCAQANKPAVRFRFKV